jgi:hypothetical protein
MIGVLGIIVLSAANSAAATIFTALLYNYATGASIPKRWTRNCSSAPSARR